MGAKGSNASISVRKEVVVGTLDAGQFTGVNFSEEDMGFAIEHKESNNIRPDRQTTDLVPVGAEAAGGFKSESVAEDWDILLPGVLFDSGWHAPVQPASACSFAIETGAGLGGKITMDANSVASLVEDQFIFLSGATLAANRGLFRIIDITGTVVQVDRPCATEAAVTLTIKGDRIRNGVTKTTYSIERAHEDISQFFLYLGMLPSTYGQEIESGEPIMESIAFIGMSEDNDTTTASTPAASDPSTNPVLNGVTSVGSISVNNVAISDCLIQKVSYEIDNKAKGKPAVGTLGYCDVDGASLKVTGKLTLYFSDATYYTKYRNSTAFSLTIPMSDSLGNQRIVHFPACKFHEMKSNVTGKDDDVLLESGFTAIVGPNGYTVQIVRIAA